MIELTRAGELRAEEGTLERYLRDALHIPPEHKVFIPSIMYPRSGSWVVLQLMEGYVFIASGLAESQYIAMERESPYVKRVLRTMGAGGIPVLHVLPDSKVEEMRQQLREMVASDITVGMRVMVTQGTYSKLDGEVVGLEGEDADVYIELRSFKVIRSIPRVFLEPLEEGHEP